MYFLAKNKIDKNKEQLINKELFEIYKNIDIIYYQIEFLQFTKITLFNGLNGIKIQIVKSKLGY